MLKALFNNDPWFEPKRRGYGASWPCAWQGWALLATSSTSTLAATLARENRANIRPLVVVVPILIFTILLMKRHTRGGWRWRTQHDEKHG